MIDVFPLVKEIVKAAFCFEMDGGNVKRLVYEPFAYEYFKENNLDFKKELADILIRTKFNAPNLEKVINSLDFTKKIVFNYKNSRIE